MHTSTQSQTHSQHSTHRHILNTYRYTLHFHALSFTQEVCSHFPNLTSNLRVDNYSRRNWYLNTHGPSLPSRLDIKFLNYQAEKRHFLLQTETGKGHFYPLTPHWTSIAQVLKTEFSFMYSFLYITVFPCVLLNYHFNYIFACVLFF